MARRSASTSRMSVDPESTFHYVWQFSQNQPSTYDPEALNQGVQTHRQLIKSARPGDKSFARNVTSRGESPLSEMDAKTRTSINVQKSLELLDEAVGTPSPLLRTARKTPSLFKPSVLKPPVASFSLPGDVSAILSGSGLSTPGKALDRTTQSMLSTKATFGDTMMESSNQIGTSSIPADVSTTNVAQILEEEPGIAASAPLYEEFMQTWKSNSAEHQVFQLLTEYEKLCTNQFDLLRQLVKKAAPGQTRYSSAVRMLEQMEQEMLTWQLVGSLYRDRLETQMQDDEEAMMVDQLDKYQSEKNIIESLFEKDALVRQSQLVLDWLEKGACHRLEDMYDKVEFHSENAGSWEHTLHNLKRKGLPMGSSRPMVDKMDPDAPIRQKRPLADLDREDEARLLKYIFMCVRAGKLEEAQQLCNKCGQAWRAATLEGWRLYHDPNYASLGPSGKVTEVEGNPYRDVWKTVCWRMAQEEAFSTEERAIYATFSGNLKQLLPVCSTWEDYVWAYYRVMVDAQVEQEIRLNVNNDRTLEPLPPCYWDKMMTAESIFHDIQACPENAVREGAKESYHMIQMFIILGDVDGLIEEMYEKTAKQNAEPSQQLLRFMTHLILFFRTVGISAKEELSVAILENYVQSLIDTKQKELIASYCSSLPQDLQIECYARFLEGIHGSEERKHCLELAEEAGLDAASICKLVVEMVRSRDTSDFQVPHEHQVDTAITEEDQEKINAIEWLVFNPGQRAEAMRQANAIARGFMALRKQTAAREVLRKIPDGSIDLIIRSWQMKTGSSDLSPEDDNTVREFFCIQAYLDGLDSFNHWFEHMHHMRPTEPRCPPAANFTERVAFEHQQKQYEAELDRWQHNLDTHTKTTTQRLYNVLLFVDGGWMIDQRKEANPDKPRLQQMELLRQLCLPNICFLLCSVLSQTNKQQECLQLADIIASEQHQLYKVFRKEEIQKLLQRLRESAVELLDQNKDPLGYEMS